MNLNKDHILEATNHIKFTITKIVISSKLKVFGSAVFKKIDPQPKMYTLNTNGSLTLRIEV